jgi:hypothetical protein
MAMVGARRYASSGWVMRMLFKKTNGEAPPRDGTMSSRYLDASPEDAILRKSLRQKSANDDYLRCTEFDREGVLSKCWMWKCFLIDTEFLTVFIAGNVTVVSGEFKKTELCTKVCFCHIR